MKRFLLLLALLNYMCASFASNENSLIILVPKTFYDHPIHLMQPRVDQWHNRGKEAEKAALATFSTKQYTVSSCNKESYGKALIVIVPSMFYNPQNEAFNSEVKAKIYTQHNLDEPLGKPTLVISSQGVSRGWLSPNDDVFTYESYRRAFNEMIQKLQSNTDFQKIMNEAAPQDFKAMCERFEYLSEQALE